MDDDFVVTGPIAIVTYLIEKAGRNDLLGVTLQDKAKIDSVRSQCDLRTLMIGMMCSSRE